MNALLNSEILVYLIPSAFIFLTAAFLNPLVGIFFMAVAMLFSPEIAIGSLGLRDLTIRIEDILIPLLLIAWIGRLALRKESRLLVASPVNLPLLLVTGFSVFSTVRGITAGVVPSPLTAFFYIAKTVEFFAIFFLVLNYVRTERHIQRFLFYFIGVFLLIGVYTLFQVPSVEIFTTRRITAPFEGAPEPASIGGYMSFLLLILMSLFLYETQVPKKWFYGLSGILTFIPFLYTLNRTSYLSFLGGLFFIAWIQKKKKFTFFLLAFLLASPLLLPGPVKERIAFTWKDAMNPRRELGVDASLQGRIFAFKKLWSGGYPKDVLLIGSGVGSWSYGDNQYARSLQETGILGLGLWIWIFTRLFRTSKWLFEYLEGGVLKGFLLGYRAGLLGIVIHGFGAITLYIVRIMEPFWFVSGLVVSLYLIKIQELRSLEEGRAEAESLEEVHA